MPRPVLHLDPPYTPEMLPAAYEHIEQLITPESDVYEFGSGYSTVWFAERARRVVSVEHDEQWARETERALRDEQMVSRVKMVEVDDEDEIPAAIEHYGEFDLILIDCLDRKRVAAISEALEHVKPGGYLVVDDSQWPMLRPGIQAVEALGWETVAVYSGNHERHTGEVKPHQTTIFQRPAAEDEEE